MISSRKSENPRVVAGVHPAASAQPPRASSLLLPRFARQTRQPIPPSFAHATNGTLQNSHSRKKNRLDYALRSGQPLLGCYRLPPALSKKTFLRKNDPTVGGSQ